MVVVILITLTGVTTQAVSANFDVIRVALIAATSVAVMFGFMSLCWLTILRWLDGIQRIIATLAVFAVAGLVQALTIYWLIPHLGGDRTPRFEVAYRSTTYMFLMAILLALGTYVVTTSRLHKKRFELLLARRATVDSLLTEIQRKIRDDQQSAVKSIERKLSAELDEIAQESPERAIISTEHLVGDVVRPLSHRIAQEVPQLRLPELDAEDFEVSWRALWRRLPVEQYLRPVSTSLVICVYVLLLQISLFDTGKLGVYLLVFPLLAFGLWLARLVLQRLASIKSRGWRAVLGTLATAVFVLPAAILLTQAAGYSIGYWELPVAFVIEAVAITWLMTLSFGLADTIRTRERELDKLEDTITWVQARGNGELWQVNGQLARALHGPVQSELHGALFAIRRASSGEHDGLVGAAHNHGAYADDGASVSDSAASQQVTTETIARLGQSLPQLLTGGHSRHGLVKEVDDTASVWQGICDIHLQTESETIDVLSKDPVANDLVISIVQDAISNSVRHGGATSVEVALHQSEQDLVTLRVTDNGTKGIGSGEAGMGTHMLQDCTVAWSLRPATSTEHSSNGSVLEACLPIETS